MQYNAYVHIHKCTIFCNHPRSSPPHPRSHRSHLSIWAVWGDAVPGSYWWHHPRWNTIQISLATPHSWHLGWPWSPWSPCLGMANDGHGIPMVSMVSPWYPHGMGIGLRTLGSLSRWIGESHGTARQCLRSISSGSQAQPGPNPYGEKPLLAFVLICFDYKSEEGKRRGN
jgi:hypothetical protein